MERDNYTQRVKDVIIYSKEEAARLGNGYIGPEHLLLGIIREGEGPAIDILQKLNVDIKLVKKTLENELREPQSRSVEENIPMEEASLNVLKYAVLEARKLSFTTVDVDHLLLALLRMMPPNKAAVVLQNNGVTYDLAAQAIDREDSSAQTEDYEDDDKDLFMSDSESDDDDSLDNLERENTSSKRKNDGHQSETPALDSFGTDMTQAARDGKFDPMVGRDKELDRMIQILCRRKKNNPVLIGEPGVGKSAIVEGLAQRIVDKKVSRILYNKRLVSLDMSSIVAGTKYRGQFEERLKALLNDLTKNPDVILFIDEIHTIVGAGNSQGSLDAANMLKPALARGSVQCIGATTLKEYRENIEKDGALERRFQKIIVDATTTDETLQILRNIKDRYEKYHCVKYTDEAIVDCVKYTDRYITDRSFPDKAIDALDEAGARMHSANVKVPESIELLEKEIAEVKANKDAAVKSQNFELAAGFRDKGLHLVAQLDEERKRWENQMKDNPQTVTADDIRYVVSMMSGVPIQRIGKNEGEVLLQLKDKLQGRLIGQNDAVDKVVKAIRRNRLGLKDPNRPIGSFIFLGPTGVGKTHLAQILAKEMFGSIDSLIRIDMSEFMEKYSVSRLIGAPPGYVGHEEGGQLTERVRRKPYSIVLFDEIEKAHPDVYNLLLQVLDEGRLTDSLGRFIDFKNTIIILTSNVGSRQLKEFGTGIGFSAANTSESSEQARGVITKALNKTFSPEFLNRIDDIVMFDQLSRDSIFKIIDLELKNVYARVEALNYKLTITPEAKSFISDKGYDIQFGARPLKRAIQKYVEDEMAEVMLDHELKSGDEIVIDVDKDKKKIITSILPQNLNLPGSVTTATDKDSESPGGISEN